MRFLSGALLALSLTFSPLYTQKAHAVILVKSFGTFSLATAMPTLIAANIIMPIVAVGVVIFEWNPWVYAIIYFDKKPGEWNFKTLDGSELAKNGIMVTPEELAEYNNENAELNSIRENIMALKSASVSNEEIMAEWNKQIQVLSPGTQAILNAFNPTSRHLSKNDAATGATDEAQSTASSM